MMNPFDWEASARRWQTSMSTSMEASGRREDPTGRHASRVYHQHRADTVEDPLNRLLTVQSGPAGQCPSASTFYPDETDQEDHELTRKIKELRKLEESERCKKVSLACKSVLDPSVAASDEESGGCTGSSLSDRVNAILQQRQSNSFLSKSHSLKRGMKSSGPGKDDNQQGEHPLKIRVNALMNHRMGRPCVSPSNTKRVISSPTEASGMDQGFQRFLNVLNKGVDVNLLRRIVSEESEELSLDDQVQDNQQHEATQSPIKSRRKTDAKPMPEHSGSGERRTGPRRPHRNLKRANDESEEEPKMPSVSPSGVKKKKEDRIKHDEQHEQLQNILTSLGLQLEVEEISKLANRTQERLYGKKTGNVNAESSRAPDRQPTHSPRSNRSCSSSSSSCSSSSGSSSPSRSSSSSYGRTSKSRTSENNSPRERSSEKVRPEKRLKVSNQDEVQFGQQCSYTQNQTGPPPSPSYSFPLLPDYTVAQYSQYSSYSSNPYQHTMSSCWTYSQAPVYPPFCPSSQPYVQNQSPQFPIAVVEQTRTLPRQVQVAQPLGKRCLTTVHRDPVDQAVEVGLTAVHRNPVNQPVEGGLTRKQKKKMRTQKNRRNAAYRKQQRMRKKLKKAAAKEKEKARGDQQPAAKKEGVNQVEEQLEDSVVLHHRGSQDSVVLHHRVSIPKKLTKHNHPLTEEEIKANLRKTLEAFNKKVKQGVTQPISSLASQTDEDLLMKL